MSGMPITAGDPPDPLPSERLSGSGVAAWVLRPEDLDRLPVLSAEPPAPRPEMPQDSRYRPSGGTWPEDGITLSYRELRCLIALHLAQAAATMPRERPWLWAEGQARAMEDGETPLRLREVLE